MSGIHEVVIVVGIFSRHGLEDALRENGDSTTPSGSEKVDFLIDISFQLGWRDCS
jgi:hypothetical protein